jgi:hypothetical protein
MSAAIAYNSPSFVSGQYNPHSMMGFNEPKYCRFLDSTIPADWMKFVIGNNGYYFKAITHQSGCSYLWFHKDQNKVELWANNMQSLYDAERRLLQRMAHICIEVLTTRGMMKEGKPVFAPEPKVQQKVMWADVEDDE